MLALIVFIWVVPFVALVTTSLRSEIASKTSGFWTAFTPTELGHRFSTHDKGSNELVTVLTGNIFERLNLEEADFPISGTVKSVLFKGRVIDPDNPDKTKLLRKLVPVGVEMDVRGGNFSFEANGNFVWRFAKPTIPKPKKLDVFITQDPVFGAKL